MLSLSDRQAVCLRIEEATSALIWKAVHQGEVVVGALAAREVDRLVALGGPGAHAVQSVHACLHVVLVRELLRHRGAGRQAVQRKHRDHLFVSHRYSPCACRRLGLVRVYNDWPNMLDGMIRLDSKPVSYPKW